jgi:hypothetical protein
VSRTCSNLAIIDRGGERHLSSPRIPVSPFPNPSSIISRPTDVTRPKSVRYCSKRLRTVQDIEAQLFRSLRWIVDGRCEQSHQPLGFSGGERRRRIERDVDANAR